MIQKNEAWKNAFLTANLNSYKNPRVDLEDVEVVLAASKGNGDGVEWVGVFILKGGDFLFLEAGYDLHENEVEEAWIEAGGDMIVSGNLDEIVEQMGDDSRVRLFKQLEPFVNHMVIVS